MFDLSSMGSSRRWGNGIGFGIGRGCGGALTDERRKMELGDGVESAKVFLFNVGERLMKGCNFICNVETIDFSLAFLIDDGFDC